MRKQNFIYGILLFLIVTLLSCQKQESKSPTQIVKYEIAGEITGSLQVTYSDNINGSNVINNVSTPWSTTLQYSREVTEISFEAVGNVTGNPGQIITFNTYINNTLVRTHTSVSDRSGKITIPLQVQSL